MRNTVSHKTVDQVLSEWAEEPREVAHKLLEFYGEPDEFTNTRILWYNTEDGWKRTILTTNQIPHNFPDEHTDFLQQTIDYRVPVAKFTPLAEFDGSIYADRTKGELSVQGASRAMNFAAVNLAHDIVVGEKTVKEARDEFTYLYKSYRDGKKLPYTEAFQFDPPRANTGDPDTSTI